MSRLVVVLLLALAFSSCSAPLRGVDEGDVVQADFVGIVDQVGGANWSWEPTQAASPRSGGPASPNKGGPGDVLLADGRTFVVPAETPGPRLCPGLPGSENVGLSEDSRCLVFGGLNEAGQVEWLGAKLVRGPDSGPFRSDFDDIHNGAVIVVPRVEASEVAYSLKVDADANFAGCTTSGQIDNSEIRLPEAEQYAVLIDSSGIVVTFECSLR